MSALVGDESDLVMDSGGYGELVWYDVVYKLSSNSILAADLKELKFLVAFSEDPIEQGIAVVEPGGDKGLKDFLCISEGEEGMELGDALEMENAGFEQMFDVVF